MKENRKTLIISHPSSATSPVWFQKGIIVKAIASDVQFGDFGLVVTEPKTIKQ